MTYSLRFAATVAATALAAFVASAAVAEQPRSQKAAYDAAANTVTVSAKAPSYTEFDWESYMQYPLDHISYVLIERHDYGTTAGEYVEQTRLTDVEPGKEFSWTDTDVTADSKYEYRLTCYVDGEKGASCYANVYCGVIPGALGGFTATTPDWESCSFEISVTAPDTDKDGNPLTTPVDVRVEVLNTLTWYEVCTFPAMEPGSTQSVNVEEGVTMGATYSLRAYAIAGTSGNGEAKEAQVYIGDDIPCAPENIQWESTPEGVTITWELPERGERGGSVNPDNVAYNIYMKYASDADYVSFKERHLGEKFSYTFDFDEETIVQFAIYSMNPTGQSFYYTATEPFTAGPYARYPFRESFTGAQFDHHSWVATGYDDGYFQRDVFGTHEYQTEYFLRDDTDIMVEPVDGDGGLLAASFYNYMEEGSVYTLTSPRIDFSGATDPAVSLWFYYIPVTIENSEHTVRVLVSAEGGEYEEIGTSASIEKTDDHGWRQLCARAPQLAGKAYGNVRIEVTRGLWTTDLSIDNIHVDEYSLAGVSLPSADTDEGAIEWYNLQGMRVGAPGSAGVYLRKQGRTVSKVLVK